MSHRDRVHRGTTLLPPTEYGSRSSPRFATYHGPIDSTGAIINEHEPGLFASLWRFKWYILAAGVLAAALGFGLSLFQSTLYQASGQVLLNDPRSSGGVAAELGLYLDPGRYVRNQAEVIESPQVAERTSEILSGAITATEVQESVSATASTEIDAVEVNGTQPTPTDAIDLVNAAVRAYGEVIEEGIATEVESTLQTLELSKLDINMKIAELDRQLGADPENATAEAQRNAALAQLVTIDTRIEQLTTNAALYGSGIQLYVPPVTPTSPVQPLPARNAALASALGVIIAGVWAWWRAGQDQRADDRNTPARILDAPLFAVVPEYGEVDAEGPIPTVSSPSSGAAEAYHFAVSSLGFALDRTGGTTVVVTSTSPGDGKSATALNMAVAAVQDGRQPLLLDADVRARGLTLLAAMDDEVGITALGNGGATRDAVIDWSLSENTAVPFVSAGSRIDGSTAGYFRSAAFKKALPKLASGRDLVLIDSPPVMSAAETTDLAAQADGVVLVVRRGTPLRDLDDTRQRLAMSGTPILGYIYNRAKSGGSGYGYGYGYDRDHA